MSTEDRTGEEGGPGLRQRLREALREAMRSRQTVRLSTLRLIDAAIKDRDIAARGEGNSEGIPDAEILAVLGKMIRQRQESARAYEEGGRLELAEKERDEIGVIEEFLPRQLTDEEMVKAIDEVIRAEKAETIRDMGRVMGALKARYAGRMDFARAGKLVKERLG